MDLPLAILELRPNGHLANIVEASRNSLLHFAAIPADLRSSIAQHVEPRHRGLPKLTTDQHNFATRYLPGCIWTAPAWNIDAIAADHKLGPINTDDVVHMTFAGQNFAIVTATETIRIDLRTGAAARAPIGGTVLCTYLCHPRSRIFEYWPPGGTSEPGDWTVPDLDADLGTPVTFSRVRPDDVCYGQFPCGLQFSRTRTARLSLRDPHTGRDVELSTLNEDLYYDDYGRGYAPGALLWSLITTGIGQCDY